MIWVTSDTHFAHRNIIKHCSRPYEDVDSMDTGMINNINDVVKKTDTLYHLGDFAWRTPAQYFLDKINCKDVRLILGNHDDVKYCGGFTSVKYYDKIKYNGNRFILMHYPLLSWETMRYDAIHLFGHCHGTITEWKEQHLPNALSMDVGVDCNNYRPLSLDEIITIMEPRKTARHGAIDHHS